MKWREEGWKLDRGWDKEDRGRDVIWIPRDMGAARLKSRDLKRTQNVCEDKRRGTEGKQRQQAGHLN